MENLTKTLLYDRYISLSQQKATEMSIKKVIDFNKNKSIEILNLESFVKFLHSKSDQIHASLYIQKRRIFN